MKSPFVAAAMAALFIGSALAQTGDDQAAPGPHPDDLLKNAPEDIWLEIDPENLLVIDLPSGPVVIEMRPDFAPEHVERIKTLARQGFYNGVIFHRVIEGFMAQGGDPTGTGTGGSDLPNLPGKFVTDLKEVGDFEPIGRDGRSPQIAFIGSMPMASRPPTLTEFFNTDRVETWPMHCPGVVSMARAGAPDSANSQFFIMLGDNRRSLDKRYTAWGKVIDGEFNVRRINVGEPPQRPTPILRARVMADIPPQDRIRYEVLRPQSETFKAWLHARGMLNDEALFVDVCSVDVPIRIGGEIAQWALLN